MKRIAFLVLLAAPLRAEEKKDPEPEAQKRVVYVPEIVKQELREEIKQEVMEQARREGWAAPDAVPAWLRRFKFSGDVRARFERDLFSRNNANSGEFPDFNAINTNKPFDVNFVDPSNERYLDVDQDRTRPRLRARLAADVEVGGGFTAGLRVASGESSNPGSSNQTLGNSGGDFSKYQLWIDRALLRWELPRDETRAFFVQAGRFENPFAGSEMLWAPDVSFDGAVVQGSARAGAFRPFLTAGAFPLYVTPLAFPSERTDKLISRNRWLYAAQLGTSWKAGDGELKLAAGFFDFDKVEGRAGNPCDTNLSFVTCDSDDSRPSFAQKGNTYFALRTPSPAALELEAAGTVSRYQFFGLASRFRELVATARYDLVLGPGAAFAAEAEYVRNAGFKKSQIAAVALNNRGPTSDSDPLGQYQGGPNGFQGRLSIGSPGQEKQWSWKARLLYRWLQSDAVLDALNDQDFGLGGTNLKGYGVDVTVWVADGVALAPRWFSASQIVGPKYAVDVLQIDLSARF
jgi:hypothetical protein